MAPRDSLSRTEKAALQTAAVIGRVFWSGPVCELVEGADPEFGLLRERDFVLGHAHYDGKNSWLNLPGPDLNQAEFANLFAPVQCTEQVFFMTTAASGFFVKPPMPLQPLMERSERKLAHSLKLVFPKMTAPAARKLATILASRPATLSLSASDPAVVAIGSADSMLSLSRIGMPCNGPRAPRSRRSRSNAFA